MQNDMTTSEGLRLIQALASIATVVYVVLTWQQVKLFRNQATTTFEDSLTTQYRRIMEDIPTDIWLGAELKALPKENQERCRDAIYRYIDLSNEQAFLHNKRRVTDEVWLEWRSGIKGNMELPAFKEAWSEVSQHFRDNFNELRSVSNPRQASAN
jgi:hypothetical protein